MKKLLLLLLLLPALTFGQGAVGLTLHELKESYPEKTFRTDYIEEGTIYITEFGCATFSYFIRKNEDVIDFCIAWPQGDRCLSAYVENFNNKYVILSDSHWKAYLEGYTMDILLEYNNDGRYTITYR